MERNVVGWTEIPVSDMDRAKKFYETVFGVKLELTKMMDTDLALFPWDGKAPGAGSALAYNEKFYKPSSDGAVLYFTAPEGDIELGLKRAVEAGGKLVLEKMSIGEHGFIGFFIDTEGNRIAIHSIK